MYDFDDDDDNTNVNGINKKLVFDYPTTYVDFSSKYGIRFDGVINLDNSIDENSNFTIFISLQHNRILLSKTTIGLWDETSRNFHYPYWEISTQSISFKKNINQTSVREIPQNKKYKQLAITAYKEGTKYNIYINNIKDFIKEILITSKSFNTNKIGIRSSYYVQRTGFSINTSIAKGMTFKKILYLETINGMNKY